MPEIKKELLKLVDGSTYSVGTSIRRAVGDEYVITEDHTLADIFRFLVEQCGGTTEIHFMLEEFENAGRGSVNEA